jgi:hypothetical protein|tara:strand:- start:6715 stop:6957 length:243 start_codon:yes stop_codon:yes gene_type:complete
MNLPKLYSIKNIQQKKAIVSEIVEKLSRLDANRFPNICMQIDNDNSKVELIETIITNIYSPMGVYRVEDAISSIEVTLND